MGGRRHKELRWERGDLSMRGRGKLPRQPPGCCGKKQFATEAAAAAVLRRSGAFDGSGYVPVRAYQCWRGWWHLTSHEARESPGT